MLTIMESVGVPDDVSKTTPTMERRKAARAKTQFKLVNGIRMTLIDWGITQGLTLLFVLLGLFTHATTCSKVQICIINFWIKNAPPPLETFLKIIMIIIIIICFGTVTRP